MASKTRKRKAAKVAASASTNGNGGRGKPWSWFDKSMADRIVALRDKDGKDWGAIAVASKTTVGKALLLYKTAKLTTKEKITGTDAEVGKAIVRLREKDMMSEGDLMARTGFAPGKLHRVYEDASGKPWGDFRIGKGGRTPSSSNGSKPASKKVASNGAKKSTKKSSRSSTRVTSFENMTDEQASAALEGRVLTIVSRSGAKPRKVRIEGAVKVAKTKSGLRAASFTDDEHKQRVIDLKTIKSVR